MTVQQDVHVDDFVDLEKSGFAMEDLAERAEQGEPGRAVNVDFRRAEEPWERPAGGRRVSGQAGADKGAAAF